MAIYISLAVSATMFPVAGEIYMEECTPAQVSIAIRRRGAVSAANPSHKATLDAIKRKYNIEIPVEEKPPKVKLQDKDELIIVQAHLPRLAEGEVHSDETVREAKITFHRWIVFAK